MAFRRRTNQLIPEPSCVDLHSKLFQPEKSSCNRHSLLLSTAEFEPALPDLRFVPIGQRDDLGQDGYINPWDNLNGMERMKLLSFAIHQYLAVDVRQGCHLFHILLIGSNPSVADVEIDAFVEQNSILKR